VKNPDFTGSKGAVVEHSPQTKPIKQNIMFYSFSLQARQPFFEPKTELQVFGSTFYRLCRASSFQRWTIKYSLVLEQ
jgi:hypothetical protein